MRAALLTIALLGLAACDREPAPAASPEPTAISEPAAPLPPASTKASGRVAFVDAGAVVRLSIACSDGKMEVAVPSFERIGSEDRLTLGAGDEAFAFAADLQAPGEGIVAGGPADADLLARLVRGEPVSALYGRQAIGPLQAVQPAAVAEFAARCAEVPAG
ncbi:hypothetical protein GCM10009116_22330 [Brevundimonas basaltis]|uniref:Lipoprotein n=1 Tax=Brevundimonas basaltis TaxID=472166 RepID=A0A7W8HZJ9_9CAUL|nr:hypothetical protein [Brevundimonas basaltis]MBB5291983.1 hypothetical protein [Brevundimonas basaltis]